MGNRRLEGQHCDENEYQDDFAEFLYEEEPSDNIDMVEQRAQPQINNEQSSPQTPLHINIASARTPATKQVIQISRTCTAEVHSGCHGGVALLRLCFWNEGVAQEVAATDNK
uniref:Uncharacterized protein n=1 Tax=Oryza rufipogon TaxID=4529 RepID=A0A0E0RGP5_ORYRU